MIDFIVNQIKKCDSYKLMGTMATCKIGVAEKDNEINYHKSKRENITKKNSVLKKDCGSIAWP